MMLFYRVALECTIRYSVAAWYGNLTLQSRSRIADLVRTDLKIKGVSNHSLQMLYGQPVNRQAQKIEN